MQTILNGSIRDRLKLSYILIVGAIGFACLLNALANPVTLANAPSITTLFLLLIAGVLVQFNAVSQQSYVVELSSIVSIATGSLFGVNAAILVIALSTLTLAIKSRWDTDRSLRNILEQFAFNLGMFAIAVGGAVAVFLTLSSHRPTFVWYWFSWMVTGLMFELLNTILLRLMFSIQGNQAALRDHLSSWAIFLNIIISSLGAGLFATAISTSGAIGVALYLFPLFLIMLTYQVHFREAERQRIELEQTVSDRTAELRVANGELTDVLAQKNRFLAVLSHDMKTPLTAIRLYAQMLQEAKTLPDPRRAKIAKTILNSEHTLTDLVLNILDVEKLKSGAEIEIIKTPIDFVDTIQAALSTIQPQADQKQIAISCNLPAQPIMLNGDATRLGRVVLNLLSNAVKYSPDSGQIELSLALGKQHCTLEVADRGYGIPADSLDKIFTPYHRVQGNNQYAGGTGLGLAVVKYMVEAHDGLIDVESEVGVGSRFMVTLPRLAISAETETLAISVDAHDATPAQPDTPPSSPHPQPNESPGPAQTHTDEQANANQS